MEHTVCIQLATGELKLSVQHSACPLSELTGFAARNNPNRGFLFVSKVLGKHWPVRPSLMQHTHRSLATMVAAGSVRGPVLAVGMAETATALGRGVFEEFCHSTGLEGLYSHTTRYRVQRCEALSFSEEHSHASQQWLHVPQEAVNRELLRSARTLMLVDDEMSTGKTLCNMVTVLHRHMPLLERVFVVTLMDMTGEEGRERIRRGMPCETSFVTLLEGSFSFTPRRDFQPKAMAKSVGDGLYKDALLPHVGGRTGIRYGQETESLALNSACLRGNSVLVLGTGEFMYEAYRLALTLEAEGRNVCFQATTRSPILLGNDIASALSFRDNYGENIDNFLYNTDSGQYDNIVLCYETMTVPPEHELPQMLGAHCCHLSS